VSFRQPRNKEERFRDYSPALFFRFLPILGAAGLAGRPALFGGDFFVLPAHSRHKPPCHRASGPRRCLAPSTLNTKTHSSDPRPRFPLHLSSAPTPSADSASRTAQELEVAGIIDSIWPLTLLPMYRIPLASSQILALAYPLVKRSFC